MFCSIKYILRIITIFLFPFARQKTAVVVQTGCHLSSEIHILSYPGMIFQRKKEAVMTASFLTGFMRIVEAVLLRKPSCNFTSLCTAIRLQKSQLFIQLIIVVATLNAFFLILSPEPNHIDFRRCVSSPFAFR